MGPEVEDEYDDQGVAIERSPGVEVAAPPLGQTLHQVDTSMNQVKRTNGTAHPTEADLRAPCDPNHTLLGSEAPYVAAEIPRVGLSHAPEYPVRRTFSGNSEDVWTEFLQYFENLSELNAWEPETSRRVLLSTLR